jgi:hypothetical protein
MVATMPASAARFFIVRLRSSIPDDALFDHDVVLVVVSVTTALEYEFVLEVPEMIFEARDIFPRE